jgi:hypothetical protein
MTTLTKEQAIAVKYYQIIRDHPETWDQSTWRNLDSAAEEYPRPGSSCPKNRCGAKLCFFGHIAEGEGGRWVSDNALSSFASSLFAESADPSDSVQMFDVNQDSYPGRTISIPYVSVEVRVARLLGFDDPEDDAVMDLYDGENELEDLRDKIMDYLGVDPDSGELVDDDCKYCCDPFISDFSDGWTDGWDFAIIN